MNETRTPHLIIRSKEGIEFRDKTYPVYYFVLGTRSSICAFRLIFVSTLDVIRGQYIIRHAKIKKDTFLAFMSILVSSKKKIQDVFKMSTVLLQVGIIFITLKIYIPMKLV